MISYDHSSEPLRKGSPSSVCGSEMESVISRSFLFHKVLINLSSPAQHCVQCQPEPSDTVLKPQLIKHLLSTLPSPFTPFQLPKHTDRKAEMNREMTRRALSLKEGSVATSGPGTAQCQQPCSGRASRPRSGPAKPHSLLAKPCCLQLDAPWLPVLVPLPHAQVTGAHWHFCCVYIALGKSGTELHMWVLFAEFPSRSAGAKRNTSLANTCSQQFLPQALK